MNYFSEIPECQIIIRNNGVYRQVDGFQRDGKIYAKYGAGYVRLLQGGGTTQPRIGWLEIDTPRGTFREERGEVTYRGRPSKVAAK